MLAYGELVFGYEPQPHHREMLQVILEALYRKEDTLILMPAGSAKTTWGNSIFLSWLISLFKNVRVGLFSQTSEFAEAFSGAIMATYEGNDEHRAVFGDISNGRKWTQKEWHRRGSIWEASKDRTLFAGGTGGQVASKRFDLLLCDDILGEDNTKTIDQREKVKDWWDKSLDPRVLASGVRIVFGTRWTEGDLYETLGTPLDEGGYGFRTHVIRALIEDPESELGFRSYWEDVWPVAKLLAMRAKNPAVFDCVYQQDIAGLLSGDIFQKRWYQGPDFYFGELPEGHSYTTRMGGDLASSTKERADFTTYVTTAEDTCLSDCPRRGHFYVLDAGRTKINSGHMEWFDHHFHNRPEWVPMPAILKLEKQHFQLTVVAEFMKERPHTPVSGIEADSDKRTRATAVAEKYRMGFAHHHKSLRDGDLEREQLGFPKGHDDLVDACGYSMELGGSSFFFGAFKMGRKPSYEELVAMK